MFYNPKRKHANNGMLSPADFEKQQKRRCQTNANQSLN
jgi:putative transposase